MTGGTDLLGGVPAAPRKRGRPPGSTNKRAADLAGWIKVQTGSTAAMQSAQLCLVTVKELKAAGGDHAKAVLAKAAQHVAAYEAEAARLDQGVRDLIRQELRLLLDETEEAKAKDVLRLVGQAVDRLKVHAGRLPLRAAVEAIAEERRALMPYTDQRQPQVVHAKGEGFAPAVVIMGAVGSAPIEQNQGVIEAPAFKVLPSGSHNDQEA
ncbi:hypothetical protein [Brevundimonas sp.]|uniref:hypothetical protein n=1 Tax=Brevundimonas sp. TaxID=1871086 RepID=UPI0028A1D5EC|nr:hypothetical protein [Brevundimonas sp.]